jgi:hypothetical protein
VSLHGAPFGHGAISELSPLSGVKLKSDFGAVRAAFDQPFSDFAGQRFTTPARSANSKWGSFLNEPDLRLCRAFAVAAGVVWAALIPIRVSDRPLSSEKVVRL